MNSRATAAKIIHIVLKEKKSLQTVLSDFLKQDNKNTALIKAMCYTCMRDYYALKYILKNLLKKDLPAKNHLLECLILIGLVQIKELRIPDHAAINETVAAAKHIKTIWAKKLINAVLRNYQRQKDKIDLNKDLEAKYLHPKWFINYLKSQHPNNWEEILIENNYKPPATIRVNYLKTTRDNLINTLLKKYKITSKPLQNSTALLVETEQDLTLLDEFNLGLYSIQDLSAQFAAEILLPKNNDYILDACAAPGGKTCHLLEQAPLSSVTAIEIKFKRALKIQENSKRLSATPQIICGNALNLNFLNHKKLFTKILVDAPCSATGIIRRQPDIKIIKTKQDLKQNSNLQLKILENLWQYLKVEGQLLYATCSIFKTENQEIIEQFLNLTKNAKELEFSLPIGYKQDFGWQITPKHLEGDGFYYALLQKTST